jgi:hypothetical protein
MDEKINKKALEKVLLAQPILDKIMANPQLENFRDSKLNKMGYTSLRKNFVYGAFSDIMKLYGMDDYNKIVSNESIPEEVKIFVKDVYNYKFERGLI